MIGTPGITLSRGGVEAVVLPAEGAVMSRLRVAGRDVLAATPWAGDRAHPPSPAATEAEWVERWRGGWQLCFPSAGEADPASPWPQGFHGVASQAPWRVASASPDSLRLEWEDEQGLTATRTWRLTDSGAAVETVARNRGAVARPLVIAEHLILGGDVLEPVMTRDAALTLTPAPGARLAALDYEGRPEGSRPPWPGAPVEGWSRVDQRTPARVAALVDVDPGLVRVEGAHVVASITWSGLDHALVWEELGRSAEPPWNRSVVALGIEPTSAPHGRGTALADGTLRLEPGGVLTWQTTLTVDWLDDEPATPRP